MQFEGLAEFLRTGRTALAKGPVAVVYDEDGFALADTVAHNLALGFRQVIVITPFSVELAEDPLVQIVTHDFRVEGFHVSLNAIIDAAPEKTWLFAAYNGEFLYYPFLETRKIGELCAFNTEERRRAFFTMIIDAYPEGGDLPSGDRLKGDTWFDGAGYYAMARHDPASPVGTLERQIDLYGGLRWRKEELIPWTKRRIDRIALFQASKGLEMREDHTMSEAELNTISCPWHHNLTVALISFRTAKALKTNGATRSKVGEFRYDGSVHFDWSSEQLMRLGMLDPGQWF